MYCPLMTEMLSAAWVVFVIWWASQHGWEQTPEPLFLPFYSMDSCDSSSLKGPRAPLDCNLQPGLQNLIFVESTYIKLGQYSGRLKMNPSGVKSTFSGGQNALKFCRLLKFILFPGSANTSTLAFLLPSHCAATRKWNYRPFPFPTSFLTKVAERSAECEQKVKLTVRRVQDNQSSTWLLCAVLWLPSWLFLPYPKDTSVSLTLVYRHAGEWK